MNWASHYDAIYGVIGVAAVLVVIETGEEVSLTVIDKTKGVDVGDGVNLQTIRPAAAVRVAELIEKAIGNDDLDGSDITFNGRAFRIESHKMAPSPAGENVGEVYLIVTEVN